VNRIITAAITVLMLSSLTPAFAESNNLSAVEHPATGIILGSPPSIATGSDSYPDFVTSQAVPVIAGGILPTNGSEGPVQTANSLPPGFTDGTEAVMYAQSVQRTFAAQAERAARARIAAGTHAQHAG
jgi:hypothetical protein